MLFEYDLTLIEKREKKLRARQHKMEMKARKLVRQVAAKGLSPKGEESWDEWLKRIESDLGMQYQPMPREDDDDVVLIEDEYVGETQQGEAVYEDRESGDLYEER